MERNVRVQLFQTAIEKIVVKMIAWQSYQICEFVGTWCAEKKAELIAHIENT
jgi:hypothetical protein